MKKDLSQNPLINAPATPQGTPAFDRIKVEHYMPAVEAAVAAAREEIEAIKSNEAAPDFANTVEALEMSGKLLNRVSLVFANLSQVISSEEMREIETDFDSVLVKFGNDVSLDEVLFERIKAVYDKKDSLSLTPVQARLLEETYKGFTRSGALLDAGGKARLREINERLSALTTEYSQNVLAATTAYEKIITDEAELSGVPTRAKNGYREAARTLARKALEEADAILQDASEKAGQVTDVAEAESLRAEAAEKAQALRDRAAMLKDAWVILLSPPPLDIAEYADNRALREEIARARSSVAYKDAFDNSPIVLEIVKLRHERAQLLGFATVADFIISERMAKTRQTVEGFIERNRQAYLPAAQAHKKEVENYARSKGFAGNLESYDFLYYDRMLKEERYAFRDEDLRPYFDLEKVLAGMFQHAEKLFGVSVAEQAAGKYPVYHPDVKVYEVTDKKTGELLAVFYGDYYARPGAKRAGAWSYSFRGRAGDEIPHVINVCNFDKPVWVEPTPEEAAQGKTATRQPSLLSMDQVRTLFHEFGHGLHDMLARGPYGSLNGTSVKWDFVELPSQVQENWALEKDVLDTFAHHHETGAPLPKELIDKMKESQNFGAGYWGLRQCFLALLDISWHTTDPSAIKSVEEIEDAVAARTALFPRTFGLTTTAFTHVFSGGYAAGYYSYKWAEALDADVFEAFSQKGLYDADLAARLRYLYEQGNNQDPADLFRHVMGRDLDPSAMFRREGVTPLPTKEPNVPPPAP